MLFVCRRGLYVFGAGASMGPALTPLSTVVVAVVVVVVVVAAATAGTETGCWVVEMETRIIIQLWGTESGRKNQEMQEKRTEENWTAEQETGSETRQAKYNVIWFSNKTDLKNYYT